MATMLSVVRRLSKQSTTGMAFIPDAIREYGAGYWTGAAELEQLAKDGKIELRPESGLGRLSKEELHNTIPGPQRTHLSWARITEEKSMGARKNAHAHKHNEWRKRQILLPETLVERLFEWHGGQSTATYALASTGMRDLVSLSMIEAARGELDRLEPRVARSSELGPKNKRELKATLAGLDEVRTYWKEHSAKEAGMGLKESDYEYDHADYGYTPDEEAEFPTKSK